MPTDKDKQVELKKPYPTLDHFLTSLEVHGKSIAVIAPNTDPDSNASALYFANRLGGEDSELTLIDYPKQLGSDYHSDAKRHAEVIREMPRKGVQVIEPRVIIGDVLNLDLESKFDLIFDNYAFKRIMYKQWHENYELRSYEKGDPGLYDFGLNLFNAYYRFLKMQGTVILVTPTGKDAEGRDFQEECILREILGQENHRFEVSVFSPPVEDTYVLRNIDKDKVAKYGAKTMWTSDGCGLLPTLELDKEGDVRLGSGYEEIAIYTIKKVEERFSQNMLERQNLLVKEK